MDRQPCVYILASDRNGTLYTGVTSNIVSRVYDHKAKRQKGFTARYGVDRLVWYEWHEAMETAIWREKTIKQWKRAWKLRLIEEMNPDWRDLYGDLVTGWAGTADRSELGRATSSLPLDPGLRRDDEQGR
jgi:putative endonuclease